MEYYLYIDTDGDFGLRVDGKDFLIKEEVRMMATNWENLEDLVLKTQVVPFSGKEKKGEMGKGLLHALQHFIDNGYERKVYGGNHCFEYGPIEDKGFDVIK